MPGIFTRQFDTPLYQGTATVNTGLFINNEYVDTLDGAPIEIVDPVTGRTITSVQGAGKADIDRAVQAAQAAFDTKWGLHTPGVERSRLLDKLADLLEANIDEFSALEGLDSGKQFIHVKMMDLKNAITTLRYYSGWADKMPGGKTIETDENKFTYTRVEPIGVVGCIVPWNFPLMIASWKLGPALAAGNCVILKPSEVTPLATLKLGELIKAAGFPPGVVNIVPGLGSVTGQAISDHLGIGKVSFTGSTAVGRMIMQSAGKSNLKRVTLELGGKTPNIVFDDADLGQAIKWTAAGIFHHAGQMCTAGSRIFVQEGIYDTFVQHFVAYAKTVQPSSGYDVDQRIDPVVSKTQFNRVMKYIDEGKSAGATVAVGGGQLGTTGYFVQPTLFTDVQPDMTIVREEIFGPVGVVIKFKHESEILAQANNTPYGLSACVYTKDISRATKLANALQAGSVFLNTTSSIDPRVPFGGFKQSGFGKEMGESGLEAYVNIKSIHVNIGQKL